MHRWMVRLRLVAALIISMAIWSVGGLIFVLMGLVLVPLLPGNRSRRIGQWLMQGAFRCFLWVLQIFCVVECEFRGLEPLNAAQGALIVAPNHPALWDAVFIISRIRGLRCILKDTLMHNPFLAGGATLAGFIENKPPHRMLQHSIEALRQGDRLLFFPEGTRTQKSDDGVNVFQGGLGIIATQSGAPVWPVIIETNSKYLCKGWPLWRLPDKKIKIRITIGEPLASPPDEIASEFTRRLRAVFVAALNDRL